MFTGQGKVVIGYKWVTSGGSQACNACRQMNGREFYLSPGPGQDSTTDMPEPPLHPNCGCKLQEIIDLKGALEKQGGELPDTQPQPGEAQQETNFSPGEGEEIFQDRFLHLRWRKNCIFNGPIYGNFCGELWNQGRDIRNNSKPDHLNSYPIDDLDAACAGHDDSYDMLDESQSDENLVKHLEGLSDDPRMWRNPPDPDKMDEARTYRKVAIMWFKWKIRRDKEKRERDDALRDSLIVSP